MSHFLEKIITILFELHVMQQLQWISTNKNKICCQTTFSLIPNLTEIC
jgi:hypothetical protein